MEWRSHNIKEQKGLKRHLPVLYFHTLFFWFFFLFIQAEVEFDYKLEDVKQRLSADFTNLQLQASQFPDVKKTSYKVTLK